jgi:sugar phosphate permease
MLIVMSLSAIVLLIADSRFPVLNVEFISPLTALANGSIWIVISHLPLAFSARGMVSTIVGVFDFSIYLGAAAASVLLGLLLAFFGWISIPAVWVVFAILACALCLGGAGTCLLKRYD